MKLHYIVDDLNSNSINYSRNLNMTDFFDFTYQQSLIIPLIDKPITSTEHLLNQLTIFRKMRSTNIKFNLKFYSTGVSDHLPMFTLIKTNDKNDSTGVAVTKRSYINKIWDLLSFVKSRKISKKNFEDRFKSYDNCQKIFRYIFMTAFP